MKHRLVLFAATFTIVLAFSTAAVSASSGPARLLKDVNPTPSVDRGSFPENYHHLGNLVIFQAYTPEAGMELWRTDGTEAGTALIKDIYPGGFWSLESSTIVEMDGFLLFQADDGVHGQALWRTDGTEAGTQLLNDIHPVLESSQKVGGVLYFPADDGVHGVELWRSDGTEAGTFMLGDIYPGSFGAFGTSDWILPFVGAHVGATFYFRALDPVHGYELWKTDGTLAGTTLVKDISPLNSYPDSLMAADGLLYFQASDNVHGFELWKSDGTEAGTTLVADVNPGSGNSYVRPLAEVNGKLLFSVYDPPGLYRTDGTEAGTVLVRSFQFQSYVIPLAVFGGNLFFAADDGISGLEMWRSDGTPEGTTLVKDINPGPADANLLGVWEMGGKLFFVADDGVHGSELWSTDGTGAGTMLVKDITPGSDGSSILQLIVAGQNLFLIAQPGGIQQLWESDGTPAGTRHIQTPSLFFSETSLDGEVLFGADDGVHGIELWKSDGTAAGTVMVKDINPSFVTDSSRTQFMGTLSIPGIGNRLFFSADDGVHGVELWTSDGTGAGTRLLKDIFPGPDGSGPSPGIVFHGALYFAANDGEHGWELWKSDGTEAGTVLVADIFPGAGSSMLTVSSFLEFKGAIYFVASDDNVYQALWKSDGTAVGTAQVAPVSTPAFFASDESHSVLALAIGNELYFSGEDSTHGLELWKTDGTEEGTVMVKDIAPGALSSFPESFTDLGGKLFMVASDAVHGFEPWMSDGTAAGTFLLGDLFPGRNDSQRRIANPQVLGGSLFFGVRIDTSRAQNLWSTDGTPQGTRLIKDLSAIHAGIDTLLLHDGRLFLALAEADSDRVQLWSSDGTDEGTQPVSAFDAATGFQAFDEGLLFTASDNEHGFELWRSNGTHEGTVMVQDIVPGTDWSYPHDFTAMGDRMFFLAVDDLAGFEEPWVARSAILFGRPAQGIQDLLGEVKDLHLPRGLESGLTGMLERAAADLVEGRTTRAIVTLETFGRLLDALSPGKISEATAADLKQFAEDIAGLLENTGHSTSAPASLSSGEPLAGGRHPILGR